ncbi:MAG TPA: flagellar assembly protein FliW [Bryobacteraceae bacterium]|jgi:flagellar assembly factor FliW
MPEQPYDEAAVLTFPAGIPGFESATRFVLREPPEYAPVVSLQSIDLDLSFLAVPVGALDAAYSLAVNEEDLRRLGLPTERQPLPGADVLCLALLCAPKTGPATANLLAPLVVNLKSRVAVQAVRSDARYSHQQPLPGDAAC